MRTLGGDPVKALRICLVGFGTVGKWLVRALDLQADRLAGTYDIGAGHESSTSRRSSFSDPNGVGEVNARVEPELVGPDDRLANVDGTANAIVLQASPVGEVAIIGPGAGPQLAGQGVFSDLIAVARRSCAP